jgi:hypothetical protein
VLIFQKPAYLYKAVSLTVLYKRGGNDLWYHFHLCHQKGFAFKQFVGYNLKKDLDKDFKKRQLPKNRWLFFC